MDDVRISYLPMDCPVCARRRLLAEIVKGDEPFVRRVECENCGAAFPDDEDDEGHGLVRVAPDGGSE